MPARTDKPSRLGCGGGLDGKNFRRTRYRPLVLDKSTIIVASNACNTGRMVFSLTFLLAPIKTSLNLASSAPTPENRGC
jgi:hypothetical protein